MLVALLALTASAEVPAAFVDADCLRCHALPEAPKPSLQESCADCHRWILDVAADPARREKARAIFPLWDRYEKTVHSYLEVPDLAAAMARLEPGWVRTWLADPHDVRPSLPETMPRLGLDGPALDALTAAFEPVSVPATPAPDRERAVRGEVLFTTRGCVACHTFGARHTGPGLPLAPDLAHTRARMSPDRAAAWIADPTALAPTARMPRLELPADEVLALRDYVFLADPQWTDAPPVSPTPLPADEPVTWAQVEERVFGRICVHCHMDPEQNEGRAGPGNAGGFGWPATGIELQTRAGVAAVADRIPATLAARRAEVHRDVVAPGQRPPTVDRPERPGMPLGLPALSDADTALVLAWIAQGMPE